MTASKVLKINHLPEPPEGLSTESREWWTAIVRMFVLDARELRLLRLAAESWDDYCRARDVLVADGQTFADSKGNPRPRPENKISNDAKVAFLKACRELNLDLAPSPAQPPRRDGQR